MKHAATLQQNNVTSSWQRRGMSILLWSLQVLLALLFLFSGSIKLTAPIASLMAQMPISLPALFVRFIGVAEVAGALGLILPGLLRIQRRLTPLAACGLVLLMVGATIYNLMASLVAFALMTAVLGALALLVAYGRRAWGRTSSVSNA